MALSMNTLIRISKQAGYKQTDRVSSLTVDMVDMLNNIKALKSMDRYGPLVQGLSGLLKRIKRSLITIQLASQGVTQGSDALVNIMTGVLIYAAYVLFDSTLPELLVTGIVFFQIVNNLTKLQKQVQAAVVVEGFLCPHHRADQAGRSAKGEPHRNRCAQSRAQAAGLKA